MEGIQMELFYVLMPPERQFPVEKSLLFGNRAAAEAYRDSTPELANYQVAVAFVEADSIGVVKLRRTDSGWEVLERGLPYRKK